MNALLEGATLIGGGRRHRRAWYRDGRAHIEVRGLQEADGPKLGAALEDALAAHPQVRWALAIPMTGRVVIDHDGLEPPALVGLVEEVESSHGLAGAGFPVDTPDHPGDREPISRELIGLAADVGGMGFAVAGRLAQFARLPVEVSSAVQLVQSQPALVHRIEGWFGPGPTDVGLGILNAVGSALAQGPLGLAIDAGRRGLRLSERLATRRAWDAAEPDLLPGRPVFDGYRLPRPDTSRADRAEPGPAEQYANRAALALVAGGAATFAATGSVRRASAALLAGTPKAAKQGMEAFTSVLGHDLAGRGIVVMDASALARLDRVDTLLVTEDLLLSGEKVLGDVDHLDTGADRTEVDEHLARLFHGGPTGDGWTLRPTDADGHGLELLRDGEVVARAAVLDGLHPEARGLVRDARDAELMVAVATDDHDLVQRLGADLVVEGGDRLLDSLRMLQTDGCSVMAAVGDPTVLACADLGIGPCFEHGVDTRVPWGAHVIIRSGLHELRFLTEAAAVAHEISRQSAAVALAGSSLGALIGLTGPLPSARRATDVVNVAAALAMANGARGAWSLRGHATRPAGSGPAWHELDVDDVLDNLDTHRDGLSSEQAALRRGAAATGERGPSLPRAFLEEIANPLTPILAGGATLSAAVGGVTDAALVGGVVVVNALLGGAQRYRVDRAVSALQNSTGRQEAVVRRDGVEVEIPIEQLAPGDIVVLEAGDAIPADCRILWADRLETDESALTGESLPVTKSERPSFAPAVADRHSMLYAGTSVASGSAEAVVVAVGSDTEAEVAVESRGLRGTGVEERLVELARITLPMAIAAGAVVTGAGLLRGRGLRQSLAPGVNLAVASVPEGLPVLTTLAELSAARRLSAHDALVRNPGAIEALGRIDRLCIDKTGTLTEGRLVLHAVSDGTRSVPVDEADGNHRHVLATALRASPMRRSGQERLPHLTDQAVVDGAIDAGVHASEGLEGWTRIDELPFKPDRTYHAVLGRNGNGNVLSVKGAPEEVIPRCVRWRTDDGEVELDDQARAGVDAVAEQLAQEGYRILAVAERGASTRADLDDDRIGELVLIGFLALTDPVRPAAAESVARLRAAGIESVMVTGDHPGTARGIAEQLGLLVGHTVVTGTELDSWDDDDLAARIDDVSVFARVTPAHKVRIVQAFQRAGHAVAMTGDGANDAPAIRLADVGIALGESSTAAARAAADLVVLTGRIETILDAIVEGRGLWGSVRDSLAILLGGNLGEIAFTTVGSVLAGNPPVSARQLLLVNLMTDVAPSLAIAVRRPAGTTPEQLLAEGPDRSLGTALNRALGVRATATAAGAGAAWTAARFTGRAQRASTVGLVALVGAQLGQTLVIGGRDPLVIAASVGSMAALAAIVQTPGVSQFFGCTPLGPVGWAQAITGAAGATALASAAPPVLDRLGILTDHS